MADPSTSRLAWEIDDLLTAAARSLATGEAGQAEALIRNAIIRRPWDAELRYRLASAQLAQGERDEALKTLAEARQQHAQLILEANAPEAAPQNAAPDRMLQLAHLFYGQNQMATASSLFQRLAEANPNVATLRLSLALSLQHQGRIEEAVAAFEMLQRHWPDPQHHSFLHYVLAFQRSTPDAMFKEGQRWSQMHGAPLPKTPPRPLPRRDGKLRIGYFSPLFNEHQLTKFFLPVMEHHDRSRFSLVCYSGAPASDATSEAIKAGSDLWREVRTLDDKAFAEQVIADDIDILVDLWGHTAGNRLALFARKPAPISVSWLNYVETTGLTEFDYVLHADGYDVAGAQDLYSETIHPIGPVLAPFRQFHNRPPAGETPMLKAGRMSFGCFGHPAKLNLEVIRVWSRILAAVPDARLVLRSGYFDDPVLRRTIHAQFEAFGIEAERIEFPPSETGAAFMATYRTVDLILDPFPYQGLTTTLDAVSCGVPVLTWEGRHMHIRIGAVTLKACGLGDDLVTTSEDAYVETAIALARAPQRLDALRARVRPGFEASPYRNEAAFTRRLEAAYLQMADTYRPTTAS